MRALISVYDKTGLDGLAKGLDELGFELVASGGTAAALEELELPVTRVEDVTGFPELLDGRVKTLHPRIHAGILARRGLASDSDALEREGIEPFDLVCVNLYPFELVAGGRDSSEEETIEMIDVGGPSMLRAAAKNHAWVTPLSRPGDYADVLRELRARGGETSLETRRRLAGIAFATTAAYEAAIAQWFGEDEEFPQTFVPVFEKELDLAYGENPHQGAAYYAERGARTHLLARVERLHGRELSFNNLNDLNAARLLVREFTLPACVIVKHANPCGVAVGASIEEAYECALAADPLAAYGGVVVLNRAVTAALGARLAEQFVEVLFAPGFDAAALEALVQKPATRILNDLERRATARTEREIKRRNSGLRQQDRRVGGADGRLGTRRQARPRRPAPPGPRLGRRRPRRHGGRLRRAFGGGLGRSPLRLADLQARRVERDRDRQGPTDDRDRRRPDEQGRRGADRRREGARARPRARRVGARVGCVLPVPGRPAARARGGCDGADPARRLEARRGRRGCGREGRRHDGLHRPPALPPLARSYRGRACC